MIKPEIDLELSINTLKVYGIEPNIIKSMLSNLQKVVNKNCNIPYISGSLLSDIRDEMDADMEDSGMAQGEIESCLNHWGNKYVIQRKEWYSNDC